MEWKERKHFNSLSEMMSHHISEEEMNDQTVYSIPFLKEGAELIQKGIKEGRKFYCFGDYDCDGVMATSIVDNLFRWLNYPIEIYIPRRFSDGYGLSEKLIDKVEPGSFIITVDNGIAAYTAIQKAKEKGCTVLLTDHHLAPKDKEKNLIIPNADCVIDPCMWDGTSEELPYFHAFCGATVAFKLASMLIDSEKYLSVLETLAGIATIADVMPLKRENRQIVIRTLDKLEKMQSTYGINCLIYALGLTHITSEDVAFQIGPIINASGRMYDDGATRIFELVTSKKTDPVKERIEDAIKTNEKRKEIQKKCIDEVLEMIKKEHMEQDFPMIIYKEGIPEGIIGIVAGRIAEDFQTPCLVFSDTETEGVLKGSGRTYEDVHLKNLLDMEGSCFIGYGGHAGAAGMSISKENLSKLSSHLKRDILKMGYKKISYHLYDMEIKPYEINSVLQELKRYEPFGEGNPKPVFKVSDFEINLNNGCYQIIGQRHLKFMGFYATAIKFNITEEEIPDFKTFPLKWTMYGQLGQNYYNGNCYNQVQLIDFSPSETREVPNLLSFLNKMGEERY